MHIEQWPTSRVQVYPGNPRRITDAAVEQVAESIRAFGFRQPIVVDCDGVIIVGHTRLLAAKSLGMTEVPVHVATDMTPAKVRAYRLADNRVGELTVWADDMLAEELAALGRIDAEMFTGFTADDIERLTFDGNFDPGTQDEQGHLDEIAPTICPACGHAWNR